MLSQRIYSMLVPPGEMNDGLEKIMDRDSVLLI